MKVKNLGFALAFVVAAPAVIAPKLVASVHAADVAEYPDVPKGHWAYDALNKLSQAGIIEGQPGGVYNGNKPMTRYEFAVAIARLLEKQAPAAATGGMAGAPGAPGAQGIQGPPGPVGPAGAAAPNQLTRAEANDLIAALRREFADELSKLGVRTSALESEVADLNVRVSRPPRLTITPSLEYVTGSANYIDDGVGGAGREIALGNATVSAGGGAAPALPVANGGLVRPNGLFSNQGLVNGKFSYTDLELRLTDRVTDRLSVNAALRSLSGTQEDPWAGEAQGFSNNGPNIDVREAFAVANLNDRKVLGTTDWTVSAGRQHTKLDQGLLYDNDLSPTDQLNGQFRVGPFSVTGVVGTTNNDNLNGGGPDNNPYFGQGAGAFIGMPNGGPAGVTPLSAIYGGHEASSVSGFSNGAFGAGVSNYLDDNESLVRVGFHLFKIAGNPVQIGLTRQFDGVAGQRGDSLALSVPLFNRTIGFQYVDEQAYSDGSTNFNGAGGGGDPHAFNLTLPILRTRMFDLNAAYGLASDNFEFFQSSSANPYARSYGEAVFDRDMGLGAPLINGREGGAGEPTYMAAKKVYDFSGTVRVIRRLPLDVRFYQAHGTDNSDLGNVFTIGSTVNLTPGLDIGLKYGQYNPAATGVANIRYVSLSANVGF